MRCFPVLLLLPLALTGCSKARHPSVSGSIPTPPAQQAATPQMAPPPTTPPQAPGVAPQGSGVTPQGSNIKGKIIERMDAPPYTYLKLKTGKTEVWTAVPETKVAKGTVVTVLNVMQMDNFESKTLKRKFEVIFFGTAAALGDAAVPAEGTAPGDVALTHAKAAKGPAVAPDVKVDKATGPDARTVAEVHAQKAALKGKPVSIHGKVVKYTAEVMGKNWMHLRDGSGDAGKGDNDIAITTKDSVKVGDLVLVRGVVRTNKDFGAGYTYEVIVEDATIKH